MESRVLMFVLLNLPHVNCEGNYWRQETKHDMGLVYMEPDMVRFKNYPGSSGSQSLLFSSYYFRGSGPRLYPSTINWIYLYLF